MKKGKGLWVLVIVVIVLGFSSAAWSQAMNDADEKSEGCPGKEMSQDMIASDDEDTFGGGGMDPFASEGQSWPEGTTDDFEAGSGFDASENIKFEELEQGSDAFVSEGIEQEEGEGFGESDDEIDEGFGAEEVQGEGFGEGEIEAFGFVSEGQDSFDLQQGETDEEGSMQAFEEVTNTESK